jgi:hypothetical protein
LTAFCWYQFQSYSTGGEGSHAELPDGDGEYLCRRDRFKLPFQRFATGESFRWSHHPAPRTVHFSSAQEAQSKNTDRRGGAAPNV